MRHETSLGSERTFLLLGAVLQPHLLLGGSNADFGIARRWYPEFAVNNTYGIKAVNDTVYEYMKFACYMIGGCLDLCAQCEQVNRSTDVGMQTCFQATDQCRTNVESPYYDYSGRGVYE